MKSDTIVIIKDLQTYQKYLLAMLIFLNDICAQNNIQYSLLDGTLLGAVRDGKMIPWDDDIDICVTRDNLKKLFAVFQNYNGRYHLNDISTKPCKRRGIKDFVSIHCQLVDKKCSSQRYCIDIFTVDYLGDDLNRAQKLIKKSKLYFDLSVLGPSFHLAPIKQSNHFLKNLRNLLFDFFFPILFLIHIPFTYFFNKSYKKFQLLLNSFSDSSKYYSIEPFLGRFGISDDNIASDGYENAKLNGIAFSVFKKNSIYLSKTYDNYMVPPPEKQRVPYHSIFGRNGIKIILDDELQRCISKLDVFERHHV